MKQQLREAKRLGWEVFERGGKTYIVSPFALGTFYDEVGVRHPVPLEEQRDLYNHLSQEELLLLPRSDRNYYIWSNTFRCFTLRTCF